jgi:hypothetical protein
MTEATLAQPQTQCQSVKCASRGSISPVSADIDLITHMSLMRGMLGQFFLHMLLIQVGI